MTVQPLQGIRIADFGQIIAIPYTAQMLAWLGAEVILIETERRLTTRIWPPFAEAEPGINRSGGFNLVNSSKMSCTLNLREPEGVDLAKQIISVSDVVLENYSSGTMERMGLGYQDVRGLRPDVVYLSLGAFGRTGPMKDLVGFHSVINLFSGLASVTGHKGSHPRIMGGLFPDAFSGCYCVLALLEALYHRAKTGEGQYIEVAMTEALATILPEAVMEYALDGTEPERVGNRHREKAPHNVFRCQGEENWVAISVDGDSQFQALAQAAGSPGWVDDPRFATSEARLGHQDELDPLIENWTKGLQAPDVVVRLQAVGVPAGPVLDSAQVLADPHMIDRGFVQSPDHPEVGPRPMGAFAWGVDGGRPGVARSAPLLGEHNRKVIQELLQVPDHEFKRLMEQGVIG
ncbi:MAG: CoA transferase [Chloroflexi bacterium]|nr:CoA transferase [Chloroflexota bacterium]MCI0900119.1 CoA transferase [Chloroflexota bacterium]